MTEAKEFPKITLEAARVNAHMLQKDAAKALGIAPVTLAAYEKGESLPDILMAHRISELYQFPLEYIFFSNC